MSNNNGEAKKKVMKRPKSGTSSIGKLIKTATTRYSLENHMNKFNMARRNPAGYGGT